MEWLKAGVNKSGVYPINPDGTTSFQVHRIIVFKRCKLTLFRSTVIWRLMVEGGLYFRGDKMDLLTLIVTGLSMRRVLVYLLENFG